MKPVDRVRVGRDVGASQWRRAAADACRTKTRTMHARSAAFGLGRARPVPDLIHANAVLFVRFIMYTFL